MGEGMVSPDPSGIENESQLLRSRRVGMRSSAQRRMKIVRIPAARKAGVTHVQKLWQRLNMEVFMIIEQGTKICIRIVRTS